MDRTVIDGRGTANEFALSQQTVYDLLGSDRRRRTVECLLRHGAVTVGDLATRVAALENDVPIDAVTTAQRRRVYTALRQFHVPKLESVGVVQFDHTEGTVAPTAAAEELRPYVFGDPRATPPWWSAYLATAVIGGGVLVLGGAGIPPFAAVPGTAVALSLAAVVGAVALVQAAVNRPSDPTGRRPS